MMTDPIADMLTGIRNANKADQVIVDIPSSRMKVEIARILSSEGYIDSYEVIKSNPQDILRIKLKQYKDKRKALTGIKRISKPGRKVYVDKNEVPKVLSGLGIAIISTSQGVLTDSEARLKGVGGEVICFVW
ncbi:MAG: 30S ribosomal protein S8 [Actinobacteria bacterium]|nr:30S ribosomal protein S8 [Actinomycetota bacterium]